MLNNPFRFYHDVDQTLADAIMNSNLESVVRIVEDLDDPANLNAQDLHNSYSMLDLACYTHSTEIAKYLIKKGAALSNKEHYGNDSAFYTAFLIKDTEILKTFIDYGYDAGRHKGDYRARANFYSYSELKNLCTSLSDHYQTILEPRDCAYVLLRNKFPREIARKILSDVSTYKYIPPFKEMITEINLVVPEREKEAYKRMYPLMVGCTLAITPILIGMSSTTMTALAVGIGMMAYSYKRYERITDSLNIFKTDFGICIDRKILMEHCEDFINSTKNSIINAVPSNFLSNV